MKKVLHFWVLGFVSGLWTSVILVTREVIKSGSFDNLMSKEKIIIGVALIIILTISGMIGE